MLSFFNIVVDKKNLLELSAKYIDDYLEEYNINGKTIDKSVIFPENSNFNPALMNNPMYRNLMSEQLPEIINLIETRYNQIMDKIPRGSVKPILEQVSLLDDALIIDVGSKIGERFGLLVAKNNPSSKVYVFNPFDEIPLVFKNQEYFRQELNGIDYYHPESFIKIDVDNLSNSINQIYSNEGLKNIEFEREYFSKETLKKIKEENPSKKIVIHSHRTPTFPKDISYDLSEMVNEFGIDIVLTPLINMSIDDKNNPILMKINQYYRQMFKIDNDKDKKINDKIYNVMTLYYALNIAMQSNAEVYQNEILKTPYHQPNFIVSTIKPR